MSQQTTNRTFDELASGLASGTLSRGKALKLMGAALVGGTLASLGIGEASADLCKRNGKACKKNSQCCSGNCVEGTCSACPTGRLLLDNGTCAKTCDAPADCPGCSTGCVTASSGDTFCAGVFTNQTCRNVNSDCPPGQFCAGNAVCIFAC